MARNYFPSSSGFGDGSVVPLGQVVIEEDGHGFLEVVGVLATRGVDLFQQADGHAQASDGVRPGDELLSDVEGVEDDSLAGSGNVGEHAMFDRVVLRAIRRIVRYAQLQPQAIRQPLEVFLEQVLLGAVAPATIAQDQQAFGLGVGRAAMLLPPQRHAVAAQFARVVAGVQVDVRVLVRQVINAVRDELALARTAEVMVEGLDGLRRKGLAGAVKIPQQFLLFRVDADHGVARILILVPQPRDVLELRVAVGMVSHRFLLPRRASSQLELPQQTSNHPPAGGRAQFEQPPRQLAQRQVGPQHSRPHRVASREFLQQLPQIPFQLRTGRASWLAAPLFFGPDRLPRPAAPPNPSSPAKWSSDHSVRRGPRTPRRHAPAWLPPLPHTAVDPSPTANRKTASSSARLPTRTFPSPDS